MRARVGAVGVVGVVVAVVLAGCGSSGKSSKSGSASSRPATSASRTSGTFPPVDQPGVTPTEIRVSGVASITNPLGGTYGSAFDGVQAYFDMVNDNGGIYGRKLVIVKRHDDQIANNAREVASIVDEDNAFAVLPVATIFSFSGASLLAKDGIPTFGWGINDEWAGPPNLYGHVGALCNGSSCPSVLLPWVASQLHKKHLAVLAYNVANSAECADQIKASFDKYPSARVVFLDKSLSFGVTDLSADVKRMVDAKVDFVTTCMDTNGVLTLAKEMRQQGLNAIQYLPNGYDHAFMAKNASFFEGSIVGVQEAPIETKPAPPGLQSYLEWMDKGGYQKTENAEVGWVNADLFVTGLKAAGPSFTRQSVVDALNRLTSYDAGGMLGPIDWTRQHTEKRPQYCNAYVRVHGGKFVPAFSPPGKPFVCFFQQPASVTSAKPAFAS